MRRSISLLLVLNLAILASGQSFGRFGHHSYAPLPDIFLDTVGIKSKHPAADMIRWETPISVWRPVETSEYEQTVFATANPGGPSKFRYSLLAPGAEIYFEKGIKLYVRSTASPYLTWDKGSVSENVPTPSSTWLGLSFRDEQPPWILSFSSAAPSLIVRGAPGQWTVESPEYSGWVHVGLPLGKETLATNSAASLGLFAKRCKQALPLFEKPLPKLRNLSIRSDTRGVVATWSFDRPGALLPPGARFAELGGYPISIRSKTNAFPMQTEDGPLEALNGPELNVFFPVRRVPAGRAVTAGKRVTRGVASASALDVPTVMELGFENLLADRPIAAKKAAEETLAQFFDQATFVREPWTNQLMPFAADGSGIDLAAANAFLRQVISKTSSDSPEPNSLLTSVSWRLDWNTWRLSVSSNDGARRAAACAALAAALSDDPEKRLIAGMMQAGLSAQRGIEMWRKRFDPARPAQKLLEPCLGLRQVIFSLDGDPEADNQFGIGLFSPIRCLSAAPVDCLKSDKYSLEWNASDLKAGVMTFDAALPLGFFGRQNLPRCESASAFGLAEIRYTPAAIGRCIADLLLASWANDLPSSAPIPTYSELRR